MKKLLTERRNYLNEFKLDIKVGDVIFGGKFKNKRIVVNKIGVVVR